MHLQAGQCGNQIGAKVGVLKNVFSFIFVLNLQRKKCGAVNSMLQKS